MGPMQPCLAEDAPAAAPPQSRRVPPVLNCPQCGAPGKVRTSEELVPTLRWLYYACPDFTCGMTWRASLQFDHVISPSAHQGGFRAAKVRNDKPPGHDFGQSSIFDLIDQTPPDRTPPD